MTSDTATSGTAAWEEILRSVGQTAVIGRSGYIPVFDGTRWRAFRNYLTIYPGAENCADPVKVDALREHAVNLLEHYPETIPQLEKLGLRVRALLNRRIETYEHVVAWADSVFNLGPVSKRPSHISDTMGLAYDDYVLEVKSGRQPVYVIPDGPRESGTTSTLDFSVPGLKARFEPRHEYSKSAFVKQTPEKPPKAPRYRGTTAEGEPRRPRGRPRKDGLIPGSPEAKRADMKREQERQAKRAARLGKQAPLPLALPKKRRLARIGEERRKAKAS